MTCSHCGYKSEIHFQTCPECSYNVIDGVFRDPQKASSKGVMPKPDTVTTGTASASKRYPALRTISTIYRLLAYLSVVVGFVGIMIGSSMMSDRDGGAGGGIVLLFILCTAIVSVTFLAISEAIHVFIDLENNTRVNNVLLQKIIEGKKSAEK